VSTWRNFNGPVEAGHGDQAEANDQHVNGQIKVWNLRKQRVLIVHVRTLVSRAPDWRVAAPLIRHPLSPMASRTMRSTVSSKKNSGTKQGAVNGIGRK
jgi:hypothetical protein